MLFGDGSKYLTITENCVRYYTRCIAHTSHCFTYQTSNPTTGIDPGENIKIIKKFICKKAFILLLFIIVNID